PRRSSDLGDVSDARRLRSSSARENSSADRCLDQRHYGGTKNDECGRIRCIAIAHSIDKSVAMKKSILVLLIGLLVGVLATVYFLGSPRTRGLPGTPLRPPDASGDTTGTVPVTIDETFFDSLLGTIF